MMPITSPVTMPVTFGVTGFDRSELWIDLFGPSLLLDFVSPRTTALGDGVSDASLDLRFINGGFSVAPTTDPATGVGRYLVQV